MPHPYRVPYSPRGSDYGPEEFAALRRVLTGPYTLSCGVERDIFEQEFKQHVNVEHAVAVSSCTMGIELVLRLIDLRVGDNVISTPQTYQSTVNPLLDSPVEVRFADVLPDTLCLSPAAVERRIDRRTRAILVTHYGGMPAEMDELKALADAYDAVLIEDCAHAHGALYKGRVPGALGHVGVYSFQSMKNMSTLGQGGMVTTNDGCLANRLRRARAVEPDAEFTSRRSSMLGPYASDPEKVFTHAKNAFHQDCTVIRSNGTNSTLPEPAAAVGRVQLRRLPEFVARRQYLARLLDSALAQIPELEPASGPHHCETAHHLYTCFLMPGVKIDNRTVCARLEAAGIEIQQRYFPLHLLPEWRLRGGALGQCPETEDTWFRRQINLPIYPAMPDDAVEVIADAFRQVFARVF